MAMGNLVCILDIHFIMHIVDDLYLLMQRSVVHMNTYMHNYYALCIMGMVDGRGYKGQHKCTICDACRPCNSSKCTKASFSPKSTDLLFLQLAQMPRSQDLVIFVSTTTTQLIT